jgi:hypothetical protein
VKTGPDVNVEIDLSLCHKKHISIMDLRTTLSINESFLAMLTDCKNRGAKAEMILDVEGLVRVEGLINELYPDASTPYLELQNGTKVLVNTIVALNGVFLPEFSEC